MMTRGPPHPFPPACQEIASYLITFEKHDEWLSCSPKTRWGGCGAAVGSLRVP